MLIWTNAERTEALVLTAAHVARQARGVRVVLYDGRLLAGEVASTDIDLDWVTLRVKGEALPAAIAWGDSASLKIGTPLVVIGDPLGYRGAMSLGVLTGRTLRWTNSGYEFLQTDAAVSPGSSGGPMFDLDGNLVGLVVGKEVANHAEGLAFALPVDTIQQSFALTQRKDQARAYLGAVLHESDDRHDAMLAPGGMTVVALDPQGPLAAAGVQVGDEIRQLGSRAVSTLADVRRLVDTIPPGTQMALTYSRGTQVQANALTLGAAPIWQAKPVARDLAARSVQDGVF